MKPVAFPRLFDVSKLDSFFEQPIMIVATIRNRPSSTHCVSAEQQSVSKHVAYYCINATASTTLLLVEETNP